MTNRHLVVCLLAFASSLWSQSSYTASVRGVVTDRSGAAVVGAKIAITETERNVPHTVVTDDAGRYAVTALPPGKYSFTASRNSLRPEFRSRCSSRAIREAILSYAATAPKKFRCHPWLIT